MRQPPTKLVRAVETAAALRAGGHSWPHIAAELGRSPETVRQWPRQYPDVWARATADTRRDLLAGACGEALNALRNLLRSDDDRTRRDAARELVRLKVDTEPADEPAARSPLHALADYLGGLSDEQRRQLLEEDLADECGPAPDGHPGADAA
jgi:hypothetical protein